MNYFIQSQQCSIQSAFLCDSHTKNHNDPQQKAGGKKWPLAISVEISSIWSHKQNNDISHDIDYQELQTFMIQTK